MRHSSGAPTSHPAPIGSPVSGAAGAGEKGAPGRWPCEPGAGAPLSRVLIPPSQCRDRSQRSARLAVQRGRGAPHAMQAPAWTRCVSCASSRPPECWYTTDRAALSPRGPGRPGGRLVVTRSPSPPAPARALGACPSSARMWHPPAAPRGAVSSRSRRGPRGAAGAPPPPPRSPQLSSTRLGRPPSWAHQPQQQQDLPQQRQ